MAKSSFGLDSVLRVATAPLPRPVQFALGSRFRFYLALVCIGFAMFFGVIHFGWNDGKPSVTVDRAKLKEIKQDGYEIVQNYQQNNPNSVIAPLLSGYFNSQHPGANNSLLNNQQPNNQQYANGYRAPTNNTPGYNTPPYTTSHPMVYPQQPNYQQPLTGAQPQYRPMPYPNNQYQPNTYSQQYVNNYNQQPTASQYGPQTPYGTQPHYGTTPQYGTPGYSNPYATPPTYNQYPTSTGYPNAGYQNTTGYPNYGQPARTSVPQYGAPGYR